MTDTINDMLQAIKKHNSAETIYQFLIKDLEEKIKSQARNTLYWKNQLSHMKKFETYPNDEEKKKALKPYKIMIKDNKKNIKAYKKSVKFLQSAVEQFNKGEHINA